MISLLALPTYTREHVLTWIYKLYMYGYCTHTFYTPIERELFIDSHDLSIINYSLAYLVITGATATEINDMYRCLFSKEIQKCNFW